MSQTTSLSLRRHPLAFLRHELTDRRVIPCADLARARDGRRVMVSGLVLVRQRPGSANGVLFMTLEDETGVANVIVWQSLFEQQRRVILGADMVAVRGRVQVEGAIIHLIAERLTDQTDLLRSVGERGGTDAGGTGADGDDAPSHPPGIWLRSRDFR